MKITAWIFILFFIPGAFAVSRVGGGKVKSNSSGFEMTVPNAYARIEPYGQDKVIARGPQFFSANRGLVELFIRIAEFADEFPDAIPQTSSELALRFHLAGWSQHSTVNNSCVLMFSRRSSSLTSYILTWGSGKGFVLNGPGYEDVDQAMQSMIQTLQLDPGACAWK